MKYGYFGLGLLALGCFGVVLIVMMQSITINNDSEYYNLKEAMKASMIESIDMTCYKIDKRLDVTSKCGSGKIKMSETKFVENFTRRFATTIGGNAKGYQLKFYDIIESPPKASVVIVSTTQNYGPASGNDSLTITNSLTGILEQDKLLRLNGRKYEIIGINEIKEVSEDSDVPSNNSGTNSNIDISTIDIDYNLQIDSSNITSGNVEEYPTSASDCYVDEEC